MKNKCQNCGKCCLNTEMIISEYDIDLILQNNTLNLQKKDFTLKIENHYQLRNKNGHCVFFNPSDMTCKIYPIRPQGCRFYPLIYDINVKSCVFDKDCPRTHLFYQSNHEFKKTCKKIKNYLREELNVK